MDGTLCERCTALVPHAALSCPSCGAAAANGQATEVRTAVWLLMGLTLGGCGNKAVALYGAEYVDDTALTDGDGDGFSPADGDCDDDNPDIHPDATETPGDGVDSNCNDEDDT